MTDINWAPGPRNEDEEAEMVLISDDLVRESPPGTFFASVYSGDKLYVAVKTEVGTWELYSGPYDWEEEQVFAYGDKVLPNTAQWPRLIFATYEALEMYDRS